MKVTGKTQSQGASAKPMKLGDFRAGDTVWVASTEGTEPAATPVRKGPMTVVNVHRYFLDY